MYIIHLRILETDLKPFLDTAAGIQQLLAWRTPSYTLLMFLVCMRHSILFNESNLVRTKYLLIIFNT